MNCGSLSYRCLWSGITLEGYLAWGGKANKV